MTPVKLGIIGTGIAARELHLPALLKLKDQFIIHHICNHSREKLDQFASLSGCNNTSLDYKNLLEDEEVDAVVILLPVEHNLNVTKAALKAGKHVMTEKPLAVNLEEAAKMVELSHRYPLRAVMTAENFYYHPGILRVKELLDDGVIGKPYGFIYQGINGLTPENRYVQTSWRINHQYEGGFLTDGGVHVIAAIRLLCGDIEKGTAQVRCINERLGRSDSMTFQFETEQGIQGTMHYYFAAPGANEQNLRILGDEGTLYFDFDKITITGSRAASEKAPPGKGYEQEYLDFYQAIRNQKLPEATFQRTYNDLKIILEALNSSGQWEEEDFRLDKLT